MSSSSPSTSPYDLIVIGAGPGGYVAAERAGAKGKRVLLIEKGPLGGVCLNEGCVPSKTLLYAAKTYSHALHGAAYGVETTGVRFNLDTVMARKAKVIDTLRKGIAAQMKRFKVEVVSGSAKFVDRQTVAVGEQTYQGQNILIATGSSPVVIPIPGHNLPHVVTSTGILEVKTLPKKLAIIGGGVIGMEFASFFSQVGVEVSVIEMLPEILPNFDADLVQMLKKALTGVTCYVGAKVESVTPDSVTFTRAGKQESVAADLVLMSVGRRPNTAGLGLEQIGLDFDPRGGIRVDECLRTNLPGIYAVGDVNGKSLLAHSASRMGEVAVNTMFGPPDHMRYNGIPWVVYSNPEVAGVGLTETQAKAQGRKVDVGKLQLRANGRFLAESDKENGLCKVIVDHDTRVLLGVYMLGHACSEMIFGAATMVEMELRVPDIQELVFPHPTVSEIFRDTVFELGH